MKTQQNISWAEKYRPKKFEDIKGQNQALKTIINFVKDFSKKGRGKNALLLYGAPGTGKTTLAHVIANETDSEIFELNASDLRNKNKLQTVLKPAIEQQSLIKQNKVILVDEVDGISGYYDRGGVPELVTAIKETNYPVIITANDAWHKKLNPIRKVAEIVQLQEISYNTIKEILLDILKKENLFINENLTTSIAARAKGDLRAAINDLQSVSRLQDPSLITLDERNKETDIFNALKLVFQANPSPETIKAYDSVKMNLDEIMLWVEENIPKEYSGVELAKAYDLLSKADVFKGRIYKQQYWRFLVYQNILLSYGISSVKSTPKTGFKNYKKPSRILKIWLNNQKTFKKKSISQKYAAYVHIGYKRAMNEYPIIKNIIKANTKIQDELKLTEDEIAYVMR